MASDSRLEDVLRRLNHCGLRYQRTSLLYYRVYPKDRRIALGFAVKNGRYVKDAYIRKICGRPASRARIGSRPSAGAGRGAREPRTVSPNSYTRPATSTAALSAGNLRAQAYDAPLTAHGRRGAICRAPHRAQ